LTNIVIEKGWGLVINRELTTIGERLKYLRLGKKKTLKELSEILGVSLNSIYRWEHDMVKPKISTLEKMAEVYDVSFSYLLKGDIVEKSNEDDIKHTCDCDIEDQILRMFNKLPENKKHKILGYVERIYVENMEETA
jgi:transcriptional regulator with XRE-family HTH domain